MLRTSLSNVRSRTRLLAARQVRRSAAWGFVAVAALTIEGCAHVPVLGFSDAATYLCLDHRIDADVLAAAKPVGDLTGASATMLAKAQWDDGRPLTLEDQDAWYVAAETDDSLLIMRTLGAAEVGDYGPPGSDREVIEVAQLPGANTVPGGWYVTADSMCPLTIDLGNLNVPTVQLDPAHMPDATASDVQLLVTENECNSGQTADGRVKLVSLVETEDSVTVTVGVKRKSGDATCQSNPATPFTVKLDVPLGDRTLIDGTRGVPLAAP